MRFAYDPLIAFTLLAVSAAATAALIVLLRPLLVRYALARPNARSSHTIPTPQGGGIPVLIAVVTIGVAALSNTTGFSTAPWILNALVAAVLLGVIGAIDDIRPLPVGPRLLAQFVAAAMLVLTLPPHPQLFPFMPIGMETTLLVTGLVWFINLTNFMDGIDWMTVVEATPICGVLMILAMSGRIPEMAPAMPIILSLLGAIIGFAPFNRHVARLFLGDVGSLPIGALLGWLLILLATSGHMIAAVILPLYYLADATITLGRRMARHEQLSVAHRSHFYQTATARGFTVPQVTQRVLSLNLLLALLAVLTIFVTSPTFAYMALIAAAAATGSVLATFEHGRVGRGPRTMAADQPQGESP